MPALDLRYKSLPDSCKSVLINIENSENWFCIIEMKETFFKASKTVSYLFL